MLVVITRFLSVNLSYIETCSVYCSELKLVFNLSHKVQMAVEYISGIIILTCPRGVGPSMHLKRCTVGIT